MQLAARLKQRDLPPAADPKLRRLADRLADALGIGTAHAVERLPAAAPDDHARAQPRGAADRASVWAGDRGFVVVDGSIDRRATVGPAIVGVAIDPRRVPACAAISADLCELGIDRARAGSVVVLDIETTGFGPGSGSIPAIVGLCTPQRDRIAIDQWVLTRGGAEGAMLHDLAQALTRRLADAAVLVTFNGRAFDVPVLRARFARWGVADPFAASPAHLDLLGVARKLWRALPDRRLATIERARLGLHRIGDVRGLQVAEILHDALHAPHDRSKTVARDRVVAHNRLDIVTPILLLARLAETIRDPHDHREALAVAAHLCDHGRVDRARVLIDRIVHATRSPDPSSIAAVLACAELRRRIGDPFGAATLWARVCAWSPGHAIAHEALAKHLEHRLRDPAAALAIASASRAPCPRRIARLSQRLARIDPPRHGDRRALTEVLSAMAACREPRATP